MGRKKLIVGFDFDGVIAYNPFRLIRSPVSFFKRNILGIKKLKFLYPARKWQQFMWIILHESSIFPAKGIDLFKQMVKEGNIEAHLITARYSFLDDHLYNWLKKNKLTGYFKTINLNKKDEQPHLFKENLLKKLNPDIFIEDNLDIVKHLHGRGRTKIFWIYNILDHFYAHPYKFPHLKKALEEILK